MASTTRAKELATFASGCSVVAVDSVRAPDTPQDEVDALLQSVVVGERGAKLRRQLASFHPRSSGEEIEDAIQTACKRFVDKADGISTPGQIYKWIRTTAHRVLNRESGYERHEIPVDPTGVTMQALVSEDPGPEGELIAGEDEADLERLAEEVISSLSERRRNVLALHGAGLRRPEIAARLGLPESTVKYDLYEIISEARIALAELSGGGCERGESLVLRFACGLASSAESAQARLHLGQCRRCGLFSERLHAWREKAGALLPVPVIERASPSLLERVAHRATESISSVKQQVLGGVSQAKQQVGATYYRAVDPTPLTAARPGTVAAVLASCVTIGGGAATYCVVNEGVNPIGAATGLITGTQEPEQKPSEPPSETTEVTPVVPSAPSPTSEEPVTGEAESPPAEAEPKPQAEPPPPPPEQSFEPSSPNYPATESSAEYRPPEPASAESAEPAPVSGGAPQFGGP